MKHHAAIGINPEEEDEEEEEEPLMLCDVCVYAVAGRLEIKKVMKELAPYLCATERGSTRQCIIRMVGLIVKRKSEMV